MCHGVTVVGCCRRGVMQLLSASDSLDLKVVRGPSRATAPPPITAALPSHTSRSAPSLGTSPLQPSPLRHQPQRRPLLLPLLIPSPRQTSTPLTTNSTRTDARLFVFQPRCRACCLPTNHQVERFALQRTQTASGRGPAGTRQVVMITRKPGESFGLNLVRWPS